MNSSAVSDPVDLLRRLRAYRAGTSVPALKVHAASGGTLRDSLGRLAADPCAATASEALLRAATEAQEVLAAADAELARERVETAAGLRAEAPDPARAGGVELLPNGTRLHYCHSCGRLAAWGFGVALDRGRDGTWFCFEHQGRIR